MINISICESDYHFRELLLYILNKKLIFNINDCYNNGLELINRIYYKQNNFLIIDTFTPITTGYEAIKVLRQRHNNTPIIAYSHVFQEDIFTVFQTLEKVYYCQKDSNVIFQLLSSLIAQDSDFYPLYLEKWQQNTLEVHEYINRQQQNTFTPTSIELQIINLICQGLTNKEIGEIVHLSARTVETYIKRLTEKFKLKNKIQLITYCVENNLHNYR